MHFDYGKKKILDALSAESLYNQNAIGDLINSIVQNTLQNFHKQQLFTNQYFLGFYSFHRSLINMDKLCETVLFHDSTKILYSENVNIFRIISDENISLEKLNQIISILKELIETIQEIYNEKENKPTVELLDSGSGINAAIKTTTNTAKSLFQIFKEIWDWVINRKFYKNSLRNAGLMENLNVMIAIKEAFDKGVITENEAKIFKEKIIRKTEDLLELNVAPKQLVEETVENNTAKVLLEFTETKMLENKKD